MRTVKWSSSFVAFNRKIYLSDKVENFSKKIYSLMSISINLNMLMKEMFPMMLASSLAAHGYYFMQLPPIHLLSALSRVPSPVDQCPIYAPSTCTMAWIHAPAIHFFGARILITLSFSIHPAALR